MKKQVIVLVAMAMLPAFADDMKEEPTPVFWGIGSTGIYSGYQLYGSLVSSEPTWQTYAELNANIPWSLGYLGAGVWSNTDITDKNRNRYGQIFNEWDFSAHWGKTFWFDDDRTWGLGYRASVVWYYYPHRMYQKHRNYGKIDTTMVFNHSFQLWNPFVIPFLDWVHEYHENNANLWQFGLKKTVAVDDDFLITPSIAFIVRSHRYNWCFPTAGFTEFHNGGLASMRIGLEANYRLFENIGIFAKIAYCQILDGDLRDAAEHGGGDDYGQYKDFAWGGVGLTWSF